MDKLKRLWLQVKNLFRRKQVLTNPCSEVALNHSGFCSLPGDNREVMDRINKGKNTFPYDSRGCFRAGKYVYDK